MLERLKHVPLAMLAHATVLVAFFLRVYRLADKNIWWDEGWSLWLARQDFSAIALRTAADEHPPLYYWMLGVWDALAGGGPGDGAFAGRWLSVAFAVLTIALVYRIGKRVGGAWIGLLAALFLAVARFHIWWSQDIKNYTPSILFAFAAVWFALVLFEKPERKAVLGYAVCAALALWTHYLAALVLLALNVNALLAYLIGRYPFSSRKRVSDAAGLAPLQGWRYWTAAQFLGAALFAPWLVLYLQNASNWMAAPAFNFELFLKLVATVLPLGVTTHIENYAPLTITLTAVAALGLVATVMPGRPEGGRPEGGRPQGGRPQGGRPQGGRPQGYAPTSAFHGRSGGSPLRSSFIPHPSAFSFGLIVLLPPLLIYLLSLTPAAFFAPKVQARYLLVLLPAYALLLAFGVALLRRYSVYLALAATLLILASSAYVLNDYYAGRRLRDEYTTIANQVNAFAQPGDLVLLDTDQEWPTFLYYLRAPLEWLGVPNAARMSAAQADALVRRAVAAHDSVWLVAIPDALATDPARLLEARLARELPKRFEQTFGDKRLALYAAAPRELVQVQPANLERRRSFPPVAFYQDRPSEPITRLLAFEQPVRELDAGDSLYLATYWTGAEARGEIRLLIPGGEPSEALRAFAFDVPAGENVRRVTEVKVPPDARPGRYALHVSMGAVSSALGEITVYARSVLAGAGTITHPRDDVFGDAIHLAGYDLPQTKFRAGESVPLTLYWRADRPIEPSYVAFVHLLGSEFNPAQGNLLWGQLDRVPRDGTYPTTAWRPAETVPDAYRVPIDARAPAGRYKIEIGLYDPATGARLPVAGGSDHVIVDDIEVW